MQNEKGYLLASKGAHCGALPLTLQCGIKGRV